MNEQPGREAEQYASAYSREYFQDSLNGAGWLAGRDQAGEGRGLVKRGGVVGREDQAGEPVKMALNAPAWPV